MNKPVYRFLSLILALALAFLGNTRVLASSPAQNAFQVSNIYFVSVNGSDTNPGTQSAPFKTFARATSVLLAGDTLQVMTGTYSETLTLTTSGTAAAPITVIGNGSVLNMQGVNANGISVSGNYVRVTGFEVTGAVDFGIYVTGNSVTIDGNNVHDNSTKNGVGTCGILTSGWGSGIKVKLGGENTTVRNNTVYNNCGEGIAVTRGVTTLIESNTTYDNFSINIYVDNSPYTTVRNNHAYCLGTHLRNGNRATGITLGEESYSGWGAQLHDVTVSGNLIRDCRYGISVFESNVGGTLTNVNISSNNVPSGQTRSISVQTLINQNVSVSSNTVFNDIYVVQPLGITLFNNVIASVTTTFADVGTNHWAWQYIEGLYDAGITGGCGNGNYCPTGTVTRGQMAVFLMKAKHGSSYAPPTATGLFQDVPSSYWSASWIEQLTAEGITSGCNTSPRQYCPGGAVTRDQMAIFLLKAKYGPSYVPPRARGLFQDVPSSYWAAAWIEQLAAEGITAGCNVNANLYCPTTPVTRDQMAVFIQRAFDLPLP